MKVELRREFYRVTYEALEWLCIAERLEEWSLSDGWPGGARGRADSRRRLGQGDLRGRHLRP